MEFTLELMKEVTHGRKCTGQGSSRRVVPMDNDIVIKIAKNKKGLEQNQKEFDISKDLYARRVNECLWISPDRKYLVAKKCEPIKWNELGKVINQILEYDEMTFKDFVLECEENFDLLSGDVDNYSSWGKKPDGTYILIDFGCTREIFNRLYRK